MLFGFSICGFITFGRYSSYFSTFGNSWTTCFNLFLGDTSPDGTMPDNIAFGWKVYYYTYLLITFFILLNILLAIIVDAYVEVKDAGSSAAGVGTDIQKIMQNMTRLRCFANSSHQEKMFQTLDPSRMINDDSKIKKKNMTSVLPNNMDPGKKKAKKTLRKVRRIIKVKSEAGNEMLTFKVSENFLMRSFGTNNGQDSNQRKKCVQEILKLLGSEEVTFEEPDSDIDENDNDVVSSEMEDDFAEAEKIAVEKAKAKQVLSYLVDKHFTRKRRSKIHGIVGLEKRAGGEPTVVSREESQTAKIAFDPF